MTKQRIYVETSIPSFFHETRTELEMAARRMWTREWWAAAFGRDELLTSTAVLDELRDGDWPERDKCLQLIEQLPVLPIDDPIEEIVEGYLKHKLMPNNPVGDALHLAVASFHGCDALVTWNCKHLANMNKFAHIRRVNGALGLHVPALVTPLELLEPDSDEE